MIDIEVFMRVLLLLSLVVLVVTLIVLVIKIINTIKKVDDLIFDVQTKSNTIQIDNIERKIAKEEATAQGLGDLRNVDDFDSQFEALNEVDLDAELEKYKSQQ